jgi:hypothetical protein
MFSQITNMHYNARYMDLYGKKKLRVLYVVLHVIQVHNILNENVSLYPNGQDCALVVLVNNYPQVWIMVVPSNEWA